MTTSLYKHMVVIVVLFSLSGCSALFTAHFDTTRLNNLTALKAMHLKFLETWVDGTGHVWNKQKVLEACDRGDTRFREAYEYAKSTDLDDGTAQKAVRLVWAQFEADCVASLEDGRLFSVGYSEEVTPRVEGNYNKAIEGEKLRIGYDK